MIANSIQMSEEIGLYLDELRAAWPGVSQVWLIERDTAWELLAFADEETLEALRGDEQRHRSDVTVLVVVDGDRFASAWGEPRSGRLSQWGWQLEDADTATFRTGSNDKSARQAVRVR